MNAFYILGILLLLGGALVGASIASTPYAFDGAARGIGLMISASAALASIIPFGFGAVVLRLDALLEHGKHADV